MAKKDDLKFILKKIFKDYNSNRMIYNGMLRGIKNRMPLGKFAQFYSQTDTDTEVNNEELYWMGKIFKIEFDKIEEDLKDSYVKSFKIEDYFTAKEVENAEKYTFKHENIENDTLVIDNVVMVSPDEFICYNISYKDISNAFNNGVTTYNFETQRSPIAEYSRVLNEMVYKPRVYAKTVGEMYKAMKNKEFIPNMITWNILKTGTEQFTYDEDKQQLIFKIGEGSQINCIDGYHRTLAIDKLITEKPKFQGHMQVKIFNFDVDKARKFIKQEAKGNKISSRRLEQLETNKYIKMAEQINDFGDSKTNLLYHKVADQRQRMYEPEAKYVYKNTLANAIKESYEDIIEEDFAEIDKVKSWLIKFLNEIITIKYDYFSNIENSIENSVSGYNNMWTFYVEWSKLLYRNTNWKSELNRLISGMDWSSDNKIWSMMSINSTREDKRVSSRIREYARTFYNEIIEKEM